MKPPAIPVILGTTATGKTSVGIELAKQINGEIISVDSRKVYRGLPVGTATPAGIWENNIYHVQGVPHYLIGHLNPTAVYNAGDFAVDGESLINEILARGKTPILVGGTGFYFKALAHGLPALPQRDEKIRTRLTREINEKGQDHVYARLKVQDPEAAKNISVGDTHKIIRSLEIIELTGRPYSHWKQTDTTPSRHSYIVMGLNMDKEKTDERIIKRSTQMVESGMLAETERVLADGAPKDCAALRSFGYKEAVQCIEGNITKDEFLAHLIHGTKAYAKRQRTWFRTQITPHWFPYHGSSENKEISLKMKAFLDNPGDDLIYSPK